MKRGEASVTHGHKRGGKRTRAYVCWMNMRARCDRPSSKSFNDYGARGIHYSPKWIKFENFVADMGNPPEGQTLDRIDSDGNYYKENCRWATRTEQNLNRRSCVRYEHGGKSQTLAEWSRETGIGRVTLLKRIQRGVPISLALTTVGYLRMPDATTGLLRIA
jgi:hypothetical protein